MLIGGGHLIRFDKAVASGYQPPSADIHHPTGYWLMPALFALQRGCRVMWNAPGALGDIPAWAEPLMRTAIENSSYVSVRDAASRDTIAPFANGKNVSVIPDTCLGIWRIIDQTRPSSAYSRLRENNGLTNPYIIVQATTSLTGFCGFVERHRERFAGYQFVSLPIGPVHGDDDAVLADFRGSYGCHPGPIPC